MLSGGHLVWALASQWRSIVLISPNAKKNLSSGRVVGWSLTGRSWSGYEAVAA